MRPLKFVVGLLPLPVCYASARTLVDLVLAIRPESLSELPLSAWSLIGGFVFWLVFWFAMPMPVRTYVLGHELTHALWGMVMGARVSKLKVSGKGGSVQLSKTNFLITLAPYFFPFYTFLVICAWFLLSVFYDLRTYEPFWLALIGLTWGFHVTFTVSALTQHQTDVTDHGYVFSYAIIVLFNLLGLCLVVAIVSTPTLDDIETGILTHLAALWEHLLLIPGLADRFKG